MIYFKLIGLILSLDLVFSSNSSLAAQILQLIGDGSYKLPKRVSLLNKKVAQLPMPIFTFQKLAGSNNSSPTVKNKDKSLSCSLEKWQLIGIFKGTQIQNTKGELDFQITNNSEMPQTIVLAELLFLDDLDRPLTIFNPHRKLQGEYIEFEKPLQPGETREYSSTIWYKSNWHKVQLKTCRWLENGSDYWQIYPELKPRSNK